MTLTALLIHVGTGYCFDAVNLVRIMTITANGIFCVCSRQLFTAKLIMTIETIRIADNLSIIGMLVSYGFFVVAGSVIMVRPCRFYRRLSFFNRVIISVTDLLLSMV